MGKLGWQFGTRDPLPRCNRSARGYRMGRSDEYRRYAAECLEIAGASHDPKSRAALLQMAQVWLRLATQRELHKQKEDCRQDEA
jgi:hypothetical protein